MLVQHHHWSSRLCDTSLIRMGKVWRARRRVKGSVHSTRVCSQLWRYMQQRPLPTVYVSTICYMWLAPPFSSWIILKPLDKAAITTIRSSLSQPPSVPNCFRERTDEQSVSKSKLHCRMNCLLVIPDLIRWSPFRKFAPFYSNTIKRASLFVTNRLLTFLQRT
jgi:hypothetical protein